MNLIKITFFLILLPVAATAAPTELSLSQFVRAYLDNSEEVIAQKANLEIAQSQLTIAQDLWAAQFTLTPSKYQTEVDYTLTSTGTESTYSETLDQLNGEWSQSLPKGFNLSFIAQKNLSNSNESTTGVDTDLKSTISMELWNNFLGRQESARIDAYAARLASHELKLRLISHNQCLQAVNLYLEGATALAKDSVFQQKYETSKKAYDIARRAYRQRLIRRIDLISAEGDQINSEAQLKDQVATSAKVLHSMQVESGLSWKAEVLQLSLPSEDFNKITVADDGWKNSLEILAQERQVESSLRLAQAVDYENRSSVELGSTFGFRDGRQAGSTGLLDYEENYLLFFLKWGLPVNNSNKARVNQALAEKNLAQAEYLKQQKQTELNYLQALSERESLQNNLAASQKKSSLYAQRLDSALTLLRSGKIDYDEYITYASSFFDEQIREADYRWQLWQNTLTLANLSHSSVPYCEATQ